MSIGDEVFDDGPAFSWPRRLESKRREQTSEGPLPGIATFREPSLEEERTMSIGSRLPGSVKRPIVRVVSMRRANREHERLRQYSRVLPVTHSRKLKVLPSREALLQQLPKGSIGAEVGVAEGDFSASIIDIVQPQRLHLIDYWQSSLAGYDGEALLRVRNRFENEIASGTVHVHRAMSWVGLAGLEEGELDWCYIDASHAFDDVRRDLAEASRRVRAGGLIAGDDYIKWAGPENRFGVVEAVNEFCMEHNWELIFLTQQRDMHMNYVLRSLDNGSEPAT